jgi:hypothetical protein
MEKIEIYKAPCPFCGGSATEPEKVSRHGARSLWRIGCSLFCVHIERPTKELVISDWNTRFSATPQSKLEELVYAMADEGATSRKIADAVKQYVKK